MVLTSQPSIKSVVALAAGTSNERLPEQSRCNSTQTLETPTNARRVCSIRPECGRCRKCAERRCGVSSATFYKWKAKFGGMEVSEAKRLKALEDENRKLKKLLAEQVMDNATLKEMLTKKF